MVLLDPVTAKAVEMTESPSGFIRMRALIARIPVSRSTIHLWIQKRMFPTSVKLSPGVTAWRIADIERWEAEKCAAPEHRQ